MAIAADGIADVLAQQEAQPHTAVLGDHQRRWWARVDGMVAALREETRGSTGARTSRTSMTRIGESEL